MSDEEEDPVYSYEDLVREVDKFSILQPQVAALVEQNRQDATEYRNAIADLAAAIESKRNVDAANAPDGTALTVSDESDVDGNASASASGFLGTSTSRRTVRPICDGMSDRRVAPSASTTISTSRRGRRQYQSSTISTPRSTPRSTAPNLSLYASSAGANDAPNLTKVSLRSSSSENLASAHRSLTEKFGTLNTMKRSSSNVAARNLFAGLDDQPSQPRGVKRKVKRLNSSSSGGGGCASGTQSSDEQGGSLQSRSRSITVKRRRYNRKELPAGLVTKSKSKGSFKRKSRHQRATRWSNEEDFDSQASDSSAEIDVSTMERYSSIGHPPFSRPVVPLVVGARGRGHGVRGRGSRGARSRGGSGRGGSGRGGSGRGGGGRGGGAGAPDGVRHGRGGRKGISTAATTTTGAVAGNSVIADSAVAAAVSTAHAAAEIVHPFVSDPYKAKVVAHPEGGRNVLTYPSVAAGEMLDMSREMAEVRERVVKLGFPPEVVVTKGDAYVRVAAKLVRAWLLKTLEPYKSTKPLLSSVVVEDVVQVADGEVFDFYGFIKLQPQPVSSVMKLVYDSLDIQLLTQKQQICFAGLAGKEASGVAQAMQRA